MLCSLFWHSLWHVQICLPQNIQSAMKMLMYSSHGPQTKLFNATNIFPLCSVHCSRMISCKLSILLISWYLDTWYLVSLYRFHPCFFCFNNSDILPTLLRTCQLSRKTSWCWIQMRLVICSPIMDGSWVMTRSETLQRQVSQNMCVCWFLLNGNENICLLVYTGLCWLGQQSHWKIAWSFWWQDSLAWFLMVDVSVC